MINCAKAFHKLPVHMDIDIGTLHKTLMLLLISTPWAFETGCAVIEIFASNCTEPQGSGFIQSKGVCYCSDALLDLFF